MKEEAKKLCKRALACRRWRWIIGCVNDLGECYVGDHIFYLGTHPDIFQPATLGCLLALVRDAHRDAYMAAGNDGPVWVVRDCDGYEVCRGTSERAVLVAALEAAP